MADDHDELRRRVDEYMARKANYDHPRTNIEDGEVISDGESDPEYQQWQFDRSLDIYVPPNDTDATSPTRDEKATMKRTEQVEAIKVRDGDVLDTVNGIFTVKSWTMYDQHRIEFTWVEGGTLICGTHVGFWRFIDGAASETGGDE